MTSTTVLIVGVSTKMKIWHLEPSHNITHKNKNNMSIHTVTMYAAICDNCQEPFEQAHTGYCAFVDKEGCRNAMVNDAASQWAEETINGREKHYCPKCHRYDLNNRIMLNTSRRVEPKIYSRDECAFNYCPSPDMCKEQDRCCNG